MGFIAISLTNIKLDFFHKVKAYFKFGIFWVKWKVEWVMELGQEWWKVCKFCEWKIYDGHEQVDLLPVGIYLLLRANIWSLKHFGKLYRKRPEASVKILDFERFLNSLFKKLMPIVKEVPLNLADVHLTYFKHPDILKL